MKRQFIYGYHSVRAVLANPLRQVDALYLSRDRSDEKTTQIQALAYERSVRVEHLSTQDMNQRFAEVTHQGIAASVVPLPDLGESDLIALLELSKQPCLILILDGVTDPHNLGACLRTAEAAGVDFIMIPKDRNAGITSVVSKVACGAAELISVVRVTNLARAIDTLKDAGVWVYGAAGEATQSLYDIDCQGSIAIIMGSEGDGLRRLTRERCDGLFSLPMLGCVESLNVSVATGVCLYEVLRQRGIARRTK